MFCHNCGSEASEQHAHCTKCGARLLQPPQLLDAVESSEAQEETVTSSGSGEGGATQTDHAAATDEEMSLSGPIDGETALVLWPSTLWSSPDRSSRSIIHLNAGQPVSLLRRTTVRNGDLETEMVLVTRNDEGSDASEAAAWIEADRMVLSGGTDVAGHLSAHPPRLPEAQPAASRVDPGAQPVLRPAGSTGFGGRASSPAGLQRAFSGGLFVVAVLLFALPWASCRADGITVLEITGFDLVTGLEQEGPNGADRSDREFLAAVALGIALLGAAAGLIPLGRGRAARAALALSGVGVLIAMQLKVNSDFDRAIAEAGVTGSASLSWEPGYWLTLLVLAGIAALQAWSPQQYPAGGPAPDEPGFGHSRLEQ